MDRQQQADALLDEAIDVLALVADVVDVIDLSSRAQLVLDRIAAFRSGAILAAPGEPFVDCKFKPGGHGIYVDARPVHVPADGQENPNESGG